MKKNILIAVIAFLTIGIATVNASETVKIKKNIVNKNFGIQKKQNIYFDEVLISSFSVSEICEDGSVYVTLGLLWRNSDGSINIQTLHYGNECPITPPPSQP